MASSGASAPRDVPPSSYPSKQATTEHDLLQSLDNLSLSTSPSTLSQSPSKHLPPPSPSGRRPSWTPLTKSVSHGSNANSPTTPTLLRKASSNSLHSVSTGTPHRAISRKSSANNLRSPGLGNSSPQTNPPPDLVQKPVPTPASVASAYFKKELELLHAETKHHAAETLVVVHDACYGHRFSRPRTTKGHLYSIVERPERLQASVLGVAMAYVRLGERHSDGRHPIHPDLDPTTLPSVPFHIHKTARTVSLTDSVVTNVHGTKWMEELKIMCDSADTKLALNGSELKRPDMDRGQDSEPPEKLHEGDLYLCPESRNAFEGALGAVCEAIDIVFSPSAHKRAFVAVRPPGHHCSDSHPSGFCWVNNVHVGIMHAILRHGLTHAAIIDFDLHHGDGSQAIAWQHNKRGLAKNAAAWKKTSIGYFSVHDINSFPCEYGDEEKVRNASVCIDNAHGQNIWNVHLNEWKTEVEFWSLYQSKYSILLEKTRKYCRLQTEKYRSLGQEPKGAIFLSAGFDASEYETDGMQRHKVNVPTEFYARLTRDVVKIASEEGLGTNGRVISVLEGGYSDRALYSGVLSHLGGLAVTDSINPKDELSSGLGQEMSSRIATLGRRRSTLTEADINSLKVPGFPYDPLWWSRPELDRFDSYVSPPPQEPKKPRNMVAPTYSSPTHASTARETDLAKVKRSVSGLGGHTGPQAMAYRVPTPPPPDVPWPAAVQELCKLLVPTDRPTSSFSWEELNAEARARRERQATAISIEAANKPPPTPSRAPTRMSLRERKPAKGSNTIESETQDKNRRKTLGGPAGLDREKTPIPSTPSKAGASRPREPSRRLSASSALTTIPQGTSELLSSDSAILSSESALNASSTSMQPPAPPALNVKKTRATPRSSPSKPRARKPKNAATAEQQLPLLPRAPSASSSVSGTSHEPAAQSSGTDDMDKITNGLKRIKINVLTKEMKAERARTEAQRKSEAEKQTQGQDEVPGDSPQTVIVPEKPLTPGLMTPVEGSLSLEATPHPPYSAPAATFHPSHPAEASSPLQVPEVLDYNVLSSPTPQAPPGNLTMDSPREDMAPDADPDLFVPYQPDGPPATTIPFSGPVQILEPNMGTPALDRKTVEQPDFSPSPIKLPSLSKMGHQFTSTSNIPFAPLPVQRPPSTVNEDTVSPLNPVIKTEEM